MSKIRGIVLIFIIHISNVIYGQECSWLMSSIFKAKSHIVSAELIASDGMSYNVRYGFTRDRGYADYLFNLPWLRRELTRTSKTPLHLLDAGAGYGIFSREVTAQFPVNVTSITGGKTELKSNEQIEVFAGKFFEEISDEAMTARFGKFDLIIDLFGVLSYAVQPDIVLERYLKNLKVGGTIHFYYNPYTFIINYWGEESLQHWMAKASGISVKYAIINEEELPQSVMVTKLKERFKIPHLTNVLYHEELPPHRAYRLEN